MCADWHCSWSSREVCPNTDCLLMNGFDLILINAPLFICSLLHGQATAGEGLHAALLRGPEAQPGTGGACSCLLHPEGVHARAICRIRLTMLNFFDCFTDDLEWPLQAPGSQTASTVISFAQKTFANGVLTSKLHVIELGAAPGEHLMPLAIVPCSSSDPPARWALTFIPCHSMSSPEASPCVLGMCAPGWA